MKKFFISALLFAAVLTAAGQNAPVWRPMGPFKTPLERDQIPGGTGRASQVKFHPTDPKTVYAVTTTGGLFISKDEGLSWKPTGSDNLPKCRTAAVCIDHTNDNIIYLATGDPNYYERDHGVWKSTDGGKTFSRSSNGLGNLLVVEILMSPLDHNILVAATESGIYRSEDGGGIWNKISSTRECSFTDMQFKPGTNSLTIYAAGAEGPEPVHPDKPGQSIFFVSYDMGVTWHERTFESNIQNGGRIAVSKDDPKVVYLSYYGNNHAIVRNWTPVYKSTDSARTFQPVKQPGENIAGHGPNSGGQGNFNFCMQADPTNANRIFMAAHYVYLSEDGGVTWNRTPDSGDSPTHTDMHHIIYSPHTGKMFMTHDGGVSSSFDGITWSDANNGLACVEGNTGVQSPIAKDVFFVGSMHNGISILNSNKNNSYTHIRGGDYADAAIMDYNSTNYFYDISRDGERGSIYDLVNHRDVVSMNYPFGKLDRDTKNETVLEFTPANKNVGFLGYFDVYRMDNVTEYNPVWKKITSSGSRVRAIGISPINANVIYVVTQNGNIVRYTDALAATPSQKTTFKPTGITSVSKAAVAVLKSNPDSVYVGVNKKIFLYSKNGTELKDVTPLNLDFEVLQIFTDDFRTDGSAYAITKGGVYYFNSGKERFESYSTGLPTIAEISKGYLFNDGTAKSELRVTTIGRGAYKAALKGRHIYREADNPTLSTGGLNYEYFEGSWEKIPNFNSLTPVKRGSVTEISLAPKLKSDEFGFRYKGFITIPADGVYTFYLDSDDGSVLYLGDEMIVDNDGFATGEERTATRALKAGKHAITVEYFENSGDERLNLSYSGPGIAKTIVPATALSRYPDETLYTGTGSITGEVWNNILVSNPTSATPDKRFNFRSFQDNLFQGENSGSRIRGYVCPPYTGNYTFAIAAGPKAELYISTDEFPANKVKICSLDVSSGCYNYDQYPSQKGTVALTAGKKYYIEALHLDHYDRDFLAVQWTLPTGEIESPIQGNRLMPFISNIAPTVQITSPQVLTHTAPVDLSLNVSAGDADGTVTKVKYYANNSKIADLTGSQFSYNWTNVSAGTYAVKAVAFDNLGDSTVSAPVTITVNQASTANVAGPDCAARNTNVYYELKPQLRAGASGYNWYFNGSVSNLNPGNQYYTNVSTGPNFTGGQLCVGVNYPQGIQTSTGLKYYDTYCKNVSYCSSSREAEMPADEMAAAVVTPNPSREAFHTTVRKNTEVMTVTDQLGKVVYTVSDLSQGQSVEFGKEFQEGVYIITFRYHDNTSETLKLIKK